MRAGKALRADYDRAVDVLYMFLGKPVPVEGNGLPKGVEIDYSLASGDPCGVTVIGYARNHWHMNLPELGSIVQRHLSVDPDRAVNAIQLAVQHEGGPAPD